MTDAFVMLGQSNMSGRGAIGALPALYSEHVLAWRGGAWETAREPVVRDRSFSGEGMGLAFGTTVYAVTGQDTGLIPCSLGGSPLSAWQPDGELFEKALADCTAVIAAGARIAGILWHQGEADSTNAELAYTYLKRFAPMAAEFERRMRAAAAELGQSGLVAAPLPVIVGELGDYLDGYPQSRYHRIINAQLHAYAAGHAGRACVTAHDLAHRGDFLHFSTASQRILGIRYACAWTDIAQQNGII